jgi:hypothetical protein
VTYKCGVYGPNTLHCLRHQHDGIKNDTRQNVAQGEKVVAKTNVDEVHQEQRKSLMFIRVL